MINKKGLSLVEIIVSIALISTITLFMYRLLADITFQKNNEFFASMNQETKIEIEEYIHTNYFSKVTKIDSCTNTTCTITKNDNSTKLILNINTTGGSVYFQIKHGSSVIRTWKLEQVKNAKFSRSGNTIKVLIYTNNVDNDSNNNNTLDDLYIYFDPAGVDDYAVFNTGDIVRSAMRAFAGNDEYKIKNFLYSNDPPDDSYLTVSTSDSPHPIYLWGIGNENIYYYSEATTIYLNPNSSNFFSDFTNLSNISGVLRFNTSKVTNMSSMFKNTAITSTEYLSSFDMSKVTDISNMFNGCRSLTSLEGLRNWDTKSLELMNSAFSYIEKVTSIEPLGGWNVEKVRDINDAFYGMKKLKSLDGLENWKIGKYNYNKQQKGESYAIVFIGGAFRGPNDVKTLEPLRSWKTYSTVFGGMASLDNLNDSRCLAIQQSGETKPPITDCYYGAFQNLSLNSGGADAISDWYFVERHTTCNDNTESKAFINMFKNTSVRPATIHIYKEAHYSASELYTLSTNNNIIDECKANNSSPNTYCLKKTALFNANGSLLTGLNTKC